MSEQLEDKYQYMCELVEDQAREIFEYKKIIAGAQKKEELMLDYIDNMCAMIYYQVQLKDHDRWLEDCISQGWYKLPEEDE
jgi:hypothetical protein